MLRSSKIRADLMDQVHVEAKGSVVFAYPRETNGWIAWNSDCAMFDAIQRVLKARVKEERQIAWRKGREAVAMLSLRLAWRRATFFIRRRRVVSQPERIAKVGMEKLVGDWAFVHRQVVFVLQKFCIATSAWRFMYDLFHLIERNQHRTAFAKRNTCCECCSAGPETRGKFWRNKCCS